MVDEERPSFVVGIDSNPNLAREAIEGLKKMVAAGEAAREALEALEKDGCCNRKVRWIGGSDDLPTLRCNRFPKYKPISPEDLPVMADLALHLMKGHKTAYGGHPCREYPLVLHGDCIHSLKTGLVRQRLDGGVDGGVLVGTLRVSKLAVSWLSHKNTAYSVTKKCRTLDATISRVARCEALDALGGVIGDCIVVRGPKGYLGQKAKDLKEAAGGWLVEQGHVVRMLEHVIRALWVEDVMEV